MDQHLLFLINRSWTSPWLDSVMAAASSWDLWWPILILPALGVAIFGGFRWRAFLVVAGLAVGINDGVIVRTLKDVVGRPRPHEMLEGVRTLDLAKARPRFLALTLPVTEDFSEARILPPTGKSFPSGHSSNNFAAATVFAVFFRRFGWLLFLPAALVAYSRVYVGSHWPLDVTASALLGTAIALFVCAAAEAIWRKFSPRWVPKLSQAHPGLIEP